MKVFLDTNVVLDLLLANRAGRLEAQTIFALAAYGDIGVLVSPISFANAAYFLEKAMEASAAKRALAGLRNLVSVVTDDESTVDQALGLNGWSDFEDALQYAAAVMASAEVIVTRNGSDFALATIPVQTPTDSLSGRSM